MASYASGIATLFELTMPGTNSKTALALAEAVVKFEAETVATFMETLPGGSTNADFLVSFTHPPSPS